VLRILDHREGERMNPASDESPQTSRQFGGRWWRRLLVGLGILVVLVIIFYAEEDWRGRRDWNQYRQALETRGEHTDFRAYIPKPVPDEQNFAATPVMRSFLQPNYFLPTNDLFAQVDDYVYATNIASARGHRHFLDLVAWQMAAVANQTGELKRELDASQRSGGFGRTHKQSKPTPRPNFATDKTDLASRAAAAPTILEGMEPDEAEFTELRLAGERPYSRFPLRYDLEDLALMPLYHLAKIKGLCQRLNLQACAELAAGQSDKALADVKLILYLANSIKTEPFLISQLVRMVCFQIAIQPLWEGLAEHRWTEMQLKELQQRFQQYDFLADMNQSLKGERTFGIQEVDQIKKKGLGMLDDLSDFENIGQTTPHKTFLNLVGRIMPAGWYDQERLSYCMSFDAQMKGVIDLAGEKVLPEQMASNSADLTRQLQDPSLPTSLKSILLHQAVAAKVLGLLNRIPTKAAAAQTAANQAAIACALERYRLANGQFPETLEALMPRFMDHLPHDVINGQPYKYRRTGDGKFILYSVGWNEKDDGGVPGKRGLFDTEEGDWVWSYPGK
jgi:hypothetical protein